MPPSTLRFLCSFFSDTDSSSQNSYSPDPLFWAVRILQRFPEELCRSGGNQVADLLAVGLRGRGKVVRENLRRAYGESVDPEWANRVHRQSWRNLIHVGLRIIRFPVMGEAYMQTMILHDDDRLGRSLEQGKGVLLLSAHAGDYYLGAACLARRYPVSVVVRSSRKPAVRRTMQDLYRKMGFEPIERVRGMNQILRALQRNSIVVMAIDQHAGKNGIPVDFFGHPASTFTAPAQLALKYGCPVHTGFVHHGEDGRNGTWFSEPIPILRTGDREEDVYRNTLRFNQEVEAFIRRYPETWMWMHRRWKSPKARKAQS